MKELLLYCENIYIFRIHFEAKTGKMLKYTIYM